MKRKKKFTIGIMLALLMMLAIPYTAFAEEATGYKIVETEKETIPVHGYLGPDAHVTNPEPEDPEPSEDTEIYVEVPVKILFAAFESDGGIITSPKHTITNLSAISDVKVEIEQFVQRPNPDVDLGNNLSLKLLSASNEELVPDLFPSNYTSGKILTENLSKYIEGEDSNKLEFMVGGTWNGSFSEELMPVFDMIIKFSAAN